jgi:hypothetical protein
LRLTAAPNHFARMNAPPSKDSFVN